VTVQNEGIVAVRFADGEVAVERARFQGPGSGLRVRGTASLDDGFALSIDSELDLALVGDLSDLVRQSGGRARAQLNVTGPIADPQLFGEATVEDGTFRLEGFAAPLTDLGGTVRFSQRSLLFEGFAADVAGGRVRLSGEASVAGTTLDRYRFDIEAEGLRYAFYEGVDVAFGAEAALSWSTGQRVPLLAGNLVVDRFEYTRPIELRSLGDVAASAFRGAFRQARTSVEAYDPDDDVLALDLRVRQQAPFRIRNDLVSAEVRIADEEGPFRILGTNQRYGVLGRMTITRGRVFFQNNDFDIRRGAIRFDDATHLDPQVDVEALTEIRRSSDLSAPSWRVSLLASGTAENLRLETRSEPELPQPDILMLLAFGMTRGELQALGGGEALAQSAALEALTAVTGVDREVSRFIPLVDDVRLTTGYSARTGRSEPRISIGSRITERVRISATTGLSESREFRAAAEWQLDDQTRLQASYDNYNVVGANSFGNLGLDVVFRLEFE
jgi:translocation and assembly module TamB